MEELKGRIVIYGIVGCPHCNRAKQLLKENKLSYLEVSVERYPAVRQWLQEKTSRTNVPQIFFNEEYVGGYDNLEAAHRDGDRWQELLALVREKEAKDDFLRIPHPSEAVDSSGESSSSFRCERDPSVELYQELIGSGIVRDKKLLVFTQLKNVFPGDRFVAWLVSRGSNEEHAIQQGNELLHKKFIASVTPGTTQFINSSKEYYRIHA